MSEGYNPLNVVSAIVGMSAVKRFHGRKTLQTQTIADHSGRAAQLAFFLGLEFYEDYTKANEVAVFALWHDFPESLLECDMPSHVKSMGDIGPALKEAEQLFVERMFPDDEYLQNLMMEVVSSDNFNLMKLADLLDCGFFIKEEVDLGNKHFDEFLHRFSSGLSKFSQCYLSLPTAQASIEFILGPPVKVI